MRKFAAFILFFLFTYHVEAQLYKKFRIGFGVGYASGSGYASGGAIGTVEPAWRFTDRIIAGMRVEWAGIARGDYKDLSANVDVARIFSVGPNVIWYFPGEVVRTFAGAGVASYNMLSIQYKLASGGPVQSSGDESKIGFYPRVGLELAHFVFSIDYNVIPKTRVADTEFRNSYLAIRFGFFLGGGRREPEQR
ncbi:MAG TPA: hypothetical protein VD927_07880 [Chryseosolibacter sp.]|nr:hypothetical protein [Chryseosolibacter sp.]